MKRALSLVTATILASGFALGACSGKEIPAGQDDGLSKDDGGGDGATEGGNSDGGPGTTLQWYSTCGYPVCFVGDGGPPVDAGVCPTEGTPCTDKGATCGVPTDENCGATYVCDDHDPKGMTCPISTRKYKDGIQYVDDAQLEALHAETLHMKLATYNYKSQVANPDPTHLGFIIEDQPTSSLAVDANHDRVDMYGYFSMIVASMQVQEKEIADLRTELQKSEQRAAACKAPKK